MDGVLALPVNAEVVLTTETMTGSSGFPLIPISTGGTMRTLSSVIAALACTLSLLACPVAFSEETKQAQRLTSPPKPFPGITARSLRQQDPEAWPSALWLPIRLGPGVVSAGPRHTGMPSDSPRCRRIGDVVYLEGRARATTGTGHSVSLGFLPAECLRRAPWEEISFVIHGMSPAATYEVNIRQAAINVGFSRAESSPGTLNISLYGISYPVE